MTVEARKAWALATAQLPAFARRVARARARLRQYCRAQGTVMVSFSGGKDSTVVLHLAASVLGPDRLVAVLRDSGCELPDTIPFCQALCDTLGVPLHIIHPPEDMPSLYQRCGILGYRGQAYRGDPVPRLTRVLIAEPLQQAAQDLQAVAVLDGLRREESRRRRYLPEVNLREQPPRIHPVVDWKAADIWAYIHGVMVRDPALAGEVVYHPHYDKAPHLPLADLRVAPALGLTGAIGERFVQLRTLYPDFFRRLAVIFPRLRDLS